MFERLKNCEGNKIVVELVNGKQISGTVVAVNQQDIRLETDEGVCVILISAIQIVWENLKRSLAEENMKDIAFQARTAEENKINPDPYKPCYQAYSRPCYQAYAQPCPQPFMPTPYEDPCFERFGFGPCFFPFGFA